MPSLLDDDTNQWTDPAAGLLGLNDDQQRGPLAPDPRADALGQIYQQVMDYQARQQADAVAQGQWTGGGVLEGGHPTGQGLLDASRQYAMGLGTKDLPEVPAPGAGFTAYHGSPHDFSAFDLSKIGTGEGVQAYGHGMYLADAEGVARGYRDELAGTKLVFPSNAAQDAFSALPQPHQDIIGNMLKNGAKPADVRTFLGNLADGAQRQADYVASGGRPSVNYGPDEAATAEAATRLAAMKTLPKSAPAGHMYEVQVNADPAHFLDWDKPLSEQPQNIQDVLHSLAPGGELPPSIATGGHAVNYLGRRMGPENVTTALQNAGIPGIRYLDQDSRGVPAANARTAQAIAERQSQIAELQADMARNQDNPNLLPPYFTARQQQIAGHQQVIGQLQQQMNENKPTSNTVVFSPEIMAIIRKYGIAGLMAGGGAAALSGQQGQQQ